MSPSRISALALSVLLASCAAPTAVRAPAAHDFGPAAVGASATPTPPLSRIEVIAPVWLATSAMQYRLLGRGETERRVFADNRWAAAPAQLLEQRLQRRLPTRSDSRCKLQLRLDELIQEFGADGSYLRFAGTVRLVGERGEDLVEGLPSTTGRRPAAPTWLAESGQRRWRPSA